MILQLALLAALQQQSPPASAGRSYLFFVASEGTDEVALMRFDAKGLRVEHRTLIKTVPGDPESPSEIYSPRFAMWDSLAPERNFLLSSAHGFADRDLMTGPRNLTIGPDRKSYFVTTSHGFPASELLAVRIAADSATTNQPADTVRSREALGTFPGVVQVTKDGVWAWVTNPTPIGDPRPSSVSIIYLPAMVESGSITTCAGARGSRFTPDGAFHYSLCAADDALVEINTTTMTVARRLDLSGAGKPRCTPGAVEMVKDGSRLFVACDRSNEIVEVDRRTWSVTQRFAVAGGPGELALTGDGRMVVMTHEANRTVSLLDTANPANVTVVAQPDSLHATPAGVAVSSDDKYAFVTFARGATEPGYVVVVDLAKRSVVASIEFGRSLAGVAFWKVGD